MPNKAEIEAKFWKALKSDRTLMLGLDGVPGGESQPMTAMTDPDKDGSGPIWFFTAKDNGLVAAMKKGAAAEAQFVSKNHEVFATIKGNLVPDDDRLTITRLWNPFVAAWFPGGKDDPKLQLIRLDAEEAQIWLNENSLFAGIRMLLGSDPKKDYKDKVATVSLDD